MLVGLSGGGEQRASETRDRFDEAGEGVLKASVDRRLMEQVTDGAEGDAARRAILHRSRDVCV